MREITSTQHDEVKRCVKLRQQRSFRYDQQQVVIVGQKMVSEVCKDGVAETLFVSDEANIPAGVESKNSFLVKPQVMKKISGVESPEGIAAVVSMPESQSIKGIKRLLVLDRISDPGNLGTLVRTALAFGWDALFLIEGSVDPFNDKVVRSSKGAVFRLCFQQGGWSEAEEVIRSEGLEKWVADMDGESLDEASCEQSIALILGHEGEGVSNLAKQGANRVMIPMVGEMESLNVAVAGGILMRQFGDR